MATNRFGFPFRLDFYSTQDLEMVVQRTAGILGVSIDDSGAYEIASRSRAPTVVPPGLARCSFMNPARSKEQLQKPKSRVS